MSYCSDSSSSCGSDTSHCKKRSKKIKYVVLNGPRGCTGATGPSNGITGPTGPTGEQGNPGTNGERGSRIFTSQENPPTTNNGTYVTNDIWINVSNGLYWSFTGSVWQQQGSLAGIRGSRITSSPLPPEQGTPPSPKTGDIHINTSNFDYWSYANGAWAKLGNIKGATGATGATGVGPTGPTGPQGLPGTIQAYGMVSRAGDNVTSISVPDSGSGWEQITATSTFDSSVALNVDQPSSGLIRYTGESTRTFTISGAITLQGYDTISHGNIFTWYKNGSTEVNSNYRVYQSTANDDSFIPASISGMVTLSKNDYIQLAVNNNTGSSQNRNLRGYYIQIHSVN